MTPLPVPRSSLAVPDALMDAARRERDPRSDTEVWDEAMERLFGRKTVEEKEEGRNV